MKSAFSVTIPNSILEKWENFNLVRPHSNNTVIAKTVEGIVRSAEDLSTITGVTILLKGAQTSTKTDSNGWFSITIEKPGASTILTFSFPGLKTVHALVSSEDFLHINLKVDREPGVKTNHWKISNLFSKTKNKRVL